MKNIIIHTKYNSEQFSSENISGIDKLSRFDKENTHWLDITAQNNLPILEELSKRFNLHTLVVKDILKLNQMPKVLDYEEYLLVIIESLKYDDNNKLISNQISLIFFENFVISYRKKERNLFNNVLLRLKESTNIRKNEADDLLYVLINDVVDGYFDLLEKISEKMDEVEDKVLIEPQKENLQEIYQLKKDLIYIRKSLWPMRNALSSIAKNDFELIDDKTLYYFRDTHDHLIQLIDIVETYREICSGMLDTYLSSISNKTNDIMKTLTIFSTIFIPLTFLAGVYGMNFKRFPELDFKYGYFSFWIISIIITVIMLRYLKRKGWF